MSNIVRFDFHGLDLRVVEIDGEPWFVAKDVTGLLGYNHTPSAVRRLDSDEYSQVTPNVPSTHVGPPPRPLTVVNEAGLYSLILGSAKPEAQAFKRWVTHEVLPTIRKTGGAYIAPGLDPDTALAKAAEALRELGI